MFLYIPSRCAVVLAPFEHAQKYSQVKMPKFDPEDPQFKPFYNPKYAGKAKPANKSNTSDPKKQEKETIIKEVKPKVVKSEEKKAEEKPEEKKTMKK